MQANHTFIVQKRIQKNVQLPACMLMTVSCAYRTEIDRDPIPKAPGDAFMSPRNAWACFSSLLACRSEGGRV